MKTLQDLKTKRVIPFETYVNNGKTVKYVPDNGVCSSRFVIFPTNFYPAVKTKKAAIHFLED
jgi:hypothetical protein